MLTKDWTKGSVIRNLLLLSWPMIVLNGLYSVNLAIEMIWVGKLGSVSIAGVGVASFIITLVISVKIGLIVGVRAMVARFVGAGDVAGACHVARQAFVISIVYSAVVAVVGVLFAEQILTLFGLEADVIAEGSVYLRIILAGWVAEGFWITGFSIMQASGDSMTPMKIAIFIRVIYVVICPFLILGWWVFPRLGVSGAATAFIIVNSLGMFLALWALFSGQTRLRLTLRNFRLDPKTIWRILKIGIPAAVMGLQRAFGNIVLAWFMAPFGTLAVAAHSLTQRVEMFINMPIFGLGVGAGVLVGQNLGAGQPERAEKSSWLATGLVGGFMVICAAVVLVWAESIIGAFNIEPGLVKLGSVFLRIAAAGYLFMALLAVLQDSITGAGDTLPPMLVSLAMIWVVQLPLAFLMSQVTDLGAYGVRGAIVAGIMVGAVANITYFRLGRWKRKKV